MAKEIALLDESLAGATLYAILTRQGQAYNAATPGLEAYNPANRANYAIALTEIGTASGYFAADFPAVAAGTYDATLYEQAGASPALGDAIVGLGEIDWTGTAVAPVQTGDAFARIGPGGAGLTALGDARLANLDAAVSTRSTYAGADTPGTTTLLARLGGPLTISGGKVAATLAAADVTGAIPAAPADGSIATATFAAGATLPRVTLVDTTTTNADMRGTDGAYTGTPPTAAAISAQVAADLATAHGAGSWASAGASAGDGSVEVDWDYGGNDLRFLAADGAGIDDATVRAYLTSEFAAGVRAIRGQTTTDAAGKWSGLMLDPGAYTLSFVKQGYLEATTTLTVA